MRLATALLCTSLAGCGTVYDATVRSTADNVYGGIRLDASIIASAATGGGDCGLQDCGKYVVWGLGIPSVLDLPLSLAGDTLLLPYTLTKEPR